MLYNKKKSCTVGGNPTKKLHFWVRPVALSIKSFVSSFQTGNKVSIKPQSDKKCILRIMQL